MWCLNEGLEPNLLSETTKPLIKHELFRKMKKPVYQRYSVIAVVR